MDICWTYERQDWVWNPSPVVSRSSASSGYCSGGIWLSAHHFWNLQFPHLQVSLMSSSCRFLSVLLVAQTVDTFLISCDDRQKERVRQTQRETCFKRIYGSCSYRCQCGIYTIVATATAQQVTALKQRWSVFKLPSELIHWPQTAFTAIVIISVFIFFALD